MITALYESNSILVTKESTSSIEVGQEVYVISFNNKSTTQETNIFN